MSTLETTFEYEGRSSKKGRLKESILESVIQFNMYPLKEDGSQCQYWSQKTGVNLHPPERTAHKNRYWSQQSRINVHPLKGTAHKINIGVKKTGHPPERMAHMFMFESALKNARR